MESAESQVIGECRPPIRYAYLTAPESRRSAFYRIWIEESGSGFKVCKESGASGRVWDRRTWELTSIQDAIRLFERRVKEKTNPETKRPRTYQPDPASFARI